MLAPPRLPLGRYTSQLGPSSYPSTRGQLVSSMGRAMSQVNFQMDWVYSVTRLEPMGFTQLMPIW